MKVFVAGATGAIGKPLVERLQRAGHQVVALCRSEGSAAAARARGAEVAIADVLDPAAVARAVREAAPDAIVHELTAIPDNINLRQLDASFQATNALRTRGTDNLLQAAQKADVERVVAQGFCGWTYAPTGGPAKDEAAPLVEPPRGASKTMAALLHLEKATLNTPDVTGVVLRYGNFYGPGTGFAPGSSMMGLVRGGKLPLVGGGTGVWSFIHIDDAAAATVHALTAPAGVYNVVDDAPAPVAKWLPHLADLLGGPRPRPIPVSLARLAIGPLGVHMMTQNRGASNAKAKSAFGWAPRFGDWREGFADVFGSAVGRPATETAIRQSP